MGAQQWSSSRSLLQIQSIPKERRVLGSPVEGFCGWGFESLLEETRGEPTCLRTSLSFYQSFARILFGTLKSRG